MGRLISPGNDKLTVVEPGDIHLGLIAARPGIDGELITTNLTVRTVALATNTIARGIVAILRGVVLPGDDKTAIRQRGHRRMGLLS